VTRFTYSIMTHPQRRTMAEALRVTLERQRCPDATYLGMSVDTERQGPWASARPAWAMCLPSQHYHMVLQDDIVVCADFLQTASHLLGLCPQRGPVTFWANRKQVPEAITAGCSWVRIGVWWGAQALAIPGDMVADMLDWVDGHEGQPFQDPWKTHDDVRISAFFQHNKIPVYATAPSLVEHCNAPSLMGHRDQSARVWVGEGPAMGLPWNNLAYRGSRKKKA